jgi:uncharacterized membrane protein
MTMLNMLAADAGSSGIWGQPVLLALIGMAGILITAVGTTYATIRVKKLNRPVDEASAEHTQVQADKVRVDIHGREVEIARSLLDEIRKELERVRADQERDRQATEKRLAEQAAMAELRHQEAAERAEKRYEQMCSELETVKARQNQLRQRMNAHAPWDVAAAELLRRQDPNFPDPPPLHED